MIEEDSRLALLRISTASCSAIRRSFSARKPKLSCGSAGSCAERARTSRSSVAAASARSVAAWRCLRSSASCDFSRETSLERAATKSST